MIVEATTLQKPAQQQEENHPFLEEAGRTATKIGIVYVLAHRITEAIASGVTTALPAGIIAAGHKIGSASIKLVGVACAAQLIASEVLKQQQSVCLKATACYVPVVSWFLNCETPPGCEQMTTLSTVAATLPVLVVAAAAVRAAIQD